MNRSDCVHDAYYPPPLGYGFGAYVAGGNAIIGFDDVFDIQSYTRLLAEDNLSRGDVEARLKKAGATVAVVYSHCNGSCYGLDDGKDGTQAKFLAVRPSLLKHLKNVTNVTNRTHLNHAQDDGFVLGGNGHTTDCARGAQKKCECRNGVARATIRMCQRMQNSLHAMQKTKQILILPFVLAGCQHRHAC